MKCIYCGSSGYGKPCVYSPTATHCHCDDPRKCIYCGSTAMGFGCVHNPYSKLHIKPAAFFLQVKEQLEKSAVLTQLFERLEQIPDQNYKSPLDRFYKRMAGTIINLSEPLLESLKLQHMPILENIEEEQKEIVSEITNRIEEQIADLEKTLKYANTALPCELVEKILLKAVLFDK
jgi:hypothetical protein